MTKYLNPMSATSSTNNGPLTKTWPTSRPAAKFVLDQLGPERAFLLRASRPPLLKDDSQEPLCFPPTSLHWETLLAEAKRQGVWPLLARYLDCHRDLPVPGAVRTVVQQRQQEIAVYNLRLTGELWLLLELLTAHGIEAIPIKGPTLAHLAFADVAGRQFTDLDVLVDRHAVARASALLKAQGYELRLAWAATQDKRFLEVTYALEFVHPGKGILVELHWALLPPYLGFEFDWARLRERLVAVQPGGKSMRTLAPDELLLYLCAHAAKHQWPTLNAVADVAWLIERQAPAWDWARLLEQARQRKLEKVLLLGLFLAAALLEAPVPDWLTQQVPQQPALRRLAQSTLSGLLAPPGAAGGMWRQFRYFSRLQPDWPARLRYGARLFAKHNVGDWEFYPLSARWSFLYFVLRPARLLRKYCWPGARSN